MENKIIFIIICMCAGFVIHGMLDINKNLQAINTSLANIQQTMQQQNNILGYNPMDEEQK